MQNHGRIGKLRQYLLLVRLPNVFTTPSNILVGYLATTPPAEANGFHLAALMVSSGLLYIAGIVLNDYFDVEVDRRERPSRPLPSGSISKERAMSIALIALAAANAIALAVSPASPPACRRPEGDRWDEHYAGRATSLWAPAVLAQVDHPRQGLAGAGQWPPSAVPRG